MFSAAGRRLAWFLAALAAGGAAHAAPAAPAEEVVGERPYEMVWAGRTQDEHPPLVDFEDLAGWTVECTDAAAAFERSRAEQIWGRCVGRLTYRAAGAAPEVRIRPPAPVKIAGPFDAVTCWIYGNNWAWAPDPETPQVDVAARLADGEGREFDVPLGRVDWTEWFLCHRRLSPAEIARVAGGAEFRALVVRGGRNAKDRTIYFDNLAMFAEAFPPLEFEPRPARGIAMFPGQGCGTNTGPGRLPFPTRAETILPDNLAARFTTALAADGDAFVFTYDGDDGRAVWRLEPKTGTLGDLSVRWEGRGGTVRPCVGGGVYLAAPGGPLAPEKAEPLGTERRGETVVSRWRLSAGGVAAEVAYTYRLWKKSLVVDVAAPGGAVAEVRYGRAAGLQEPRLVTNPFYAYGGARPAVAVSGTADAPLFLAGHTDWCLSNASELWAENAADAPGVAYNGGARYIPRTDGRRNDCYERLFLVLSPRYEEVLPTIPNPPSPWKRVTGTHLWRAHGAGDRAADVRFWTECRRWGMTEVAVTDHETMWRDGGESFTFRTRAAPKKGGDRGAFDYARTMQDTLGFVYGPYNNFTDFAPVNEFWSADRVTRTAENQLQRAWARCYAPKPARAVEFCALLAPRIQEKFRFSTAYCDVHTAVPTWSRVDYDARVPGAGTFAAVFYAFGEIMLLQKAAWSGPVYSEGNYHYMYCGLTDGNYGQDQSYRPAEKPWLVDFDLRKMHDLACNFGMGSPDMFWVGRERWDTPAASDRTVDRFLAATVAFGHPGFLVWEGGVGNALRSYYMLQQLHSRYALARAESIRYADAGGRLLDTSRAVASGAFRRSQVVTRYADGTVTAANGHPSERLAAEAFGRRIDLPPDGYAGWTSDGAVEVLSGDPGGHRADYAATPAYLYVDGRGRLVRFPRAASGGQGVCRILAGGRHEVIPNGGAECGFAVGPATAVALDAEGKEMGPARVRSARGLEWVVPVEGAFSYRLEPAGAAEGPALTSERDEVVAGETVRVRGREEHTLRIPPDAADGDRVWAEFEGAWIDFTVVPAFDVGLGLRGDALAVDLVSRLPQAEDATVRAAGRERTVRLEPGRPATVAIDLGPPEREAAEVLVVEVRAGDAVQRVERSLITRLGRPPVAAMPTEWRAGMRLRGGEETADLGSTRAHVDAGRQASGGVAKDGLTMHPPWTGGVGYVFALYDPVTLPAAPAAALRASVGKGDGSDPGDGILYRAAVVEDDGRETVVAERSVTEHAWAPIEGDLSPWAGKTVRLKLIADVGPRDDSGGDWAAWADLRIEALAPHLVRSLEAAAPGVP